MGTESRLQSGEVAGRARAIAVGLPFRSARWSRTLPLRVPGSQTPQRLAAGLAALIVIWALVGFGFEQVRFISLSPRTQPTIEATSALARLFSAFILFVYPAFRAAQRLRWVAAGFVILALGGFLFGYLPPELGKPLPLDVSISSWVAVRIVAGILFLIGLVPGLAPRFTWRWMAFAIVALAALTGPMVLARHAPLAMTSLPSSLGSVPYGRIPLSRLTGWHWTTEVIAMSIALGALVGAARVVKVDGVGGWLLLAMVLHAGSQLHGALWPSPYGPVVTSADILRDAFALVVCVGALLELRRVAEERSMLLGLEREYSRSLMEQDALKSNFVAMVAHELGSPIAAIRGLTEMLGSGEIPPAEAESSLKTEADLLAALVGDVQVGMAIQQQDFTVEERPVLLSTLLGDAAAFARILPGELPVVRTLTRDEWVLADPERIRQVLRNLLTNAAKYSPAGAPIELRATILEGDRARIEVIDRGFGVHPDDVAHIFEKFERGRDAKGLRVPGVGLGLYLSRRIVQAHGSDLTLVDRREGGSIFRFDLRAVPEAERSSLRSSTPIRVLIVDDHASFRQALARVLARESDIASVAQAGTYSGARDFLCDAEVALIDLHLPDGDGSALIAELRSANPAAAVLAVTAASEPHELARAVEAGATGIIHKSASIDEIISAVRRAAARESILSSREILEMIRIARQQRDQAAGAETDLAHLTPREREVLQALAEGLSDKEIATRLTISTATARTHVVNILAKLGVNSRLQAVVLAARHGEINIG